MRLYALCVYLFLYTPIAIIALFSFNAGRHASQLQGFSTQWYARALKNPFVMDALETSLIVAFVTACLASVFGTMAAIALQGVTGWFRSLFDALIYIAVMIPGIVIGIATLIALVTVFGWLNPMIAALWPEGVAPPQLAMGMGTLIAAHTIPGWFERDCRKRELVAARTTEPIVVDGRLEEAVWSQARRIEHFLDRRRLRLESLETVGRLAYDDNTLYV